MTTKVSVDEKNVATLDIQVNSDIVKKMYDQTVRAFSSNVNIAGFRRGKAPVNVVEKYVGEERIKAEVIDRLFPSEFQKAVDENKLNIAFRPSIEDVKFNVGEDLELKVKVELKPDFKVAQYKDTEVKYEAFKNPESALDEELKEVQRRFSTLEKKEGEATGEDTVVFDFDGYVGDEKIEHGSASNYTLDLAHSNFIPGFAEGLVGHKAGEEFDIDVTFPENYHEDKLKGAKATFKIKLHEVKSRVLPELDDELAKKMNKKSFEEMKEDIQKYLNDLEENENKRIKADAIFNKISDETKIEIQPSMLNREYEAIVAEARANAQRQGQNYDELIEKEGKDKAEQRLKEEAQKRIKNSLIVEKIVSEADIKIEQKDIMEHINQLAMMYGIAPNQLFEEISKNPQSYGAMTQQILAHKVNTYLVENNKFTEK